jgi:hypothetical protein
MDFKSNISPKNTCNDIEAEEKNSQCLKSNDFIEDIERQETHSEEASSLEGVENLQQTASHVSNAEITAVDPYAEAGDEIYNRFSPRRKKVMTFVLSFCGFLAPISSTTVLSAVPEVAATYNTTGSIINISNALYLIFMGLSRKWLFHFRDQILITLIAVFWGPVGQIYGRRWVSTLSKTSEILRNKKSNVSHS